MWHAWERRGICPVFWLENLKESNHLKDLCTDKRMILKWILTRMGGCQLDSSGTAWGSVGGGALETGKEPSVFIKFGVFLG